MADKVLIVLDGTYRFAPLMNNGGAADFTFVELVDALENLGGYTVVKAHRGLEIDGQKDNSADHPEFNFVTSGVDLREFVAIWLIGHSGRNDPDSMGTSPAAMSEDQIAAIARYMAAGGGVFATGDHDSIGCVMCGRIPRVRAMRSWYGAGDSEYPANMGDFPRNFPSKSHLRADTTQRNPDSDYEGDAQRVWFENQSDKLPQPIAAETTPSHPILHLPGGGDAEHYPDHMHEGRALGFVDTYEYDKMLDFDGQSFVEFPEVAGAREMPVVIASGTSLSHTTWYAHDAGSELDNQLADEREIATLSVYEGRNAGVGRIVTGSTFHHYIDINLTGDSAINLPGETDRATLSARKNHGFKDDEDIRTEIKQVFVNITRWLARPQPGIELILERSTFGEDEATANPNFEGAILVTVDGLTPSQFPGGPIDSLLPGDFNPDWAPDIVAMEPAGLNFVKTGVDSDDPTLADRLQRFTFRYRVEVAAAAFAFDPDEFNTVRVDATLDSPATADPLTDFAFIELVKSANPFMLDLDNGNETVWLSSDLRVFHVIADGSPLAEGADREAALTYLHGRVNAMTVGEFEDLPLTQSGSTLSAFPTTTGGGDNVYNFAIARVRLNGSVAAANDVRVFFRIVPAPTTAALTYQSSMNVPFGTYKKTGGAAPIALPGTSGNQWVSFPCFSATREAVPEDQEDPDNVEAEILPDPGNEVSTFFGALIDNNLDDLYLRPTPTSMAAKMSLRDLMMGEHQCLVAQIEYAGTPIPNGARPSTSDKLAQRNLALSEIANPGLDASRTALHTFEIEATPRAIAEALPPDELLLDWGKTAPPDGTEVRLYMSGWSAADVVALADRFYPRHELRALDANTIALPGGGTRYVPIPRGQIRRTGVIMAELPLGVKRGQRFDLSVRQVTNRGRQLVVPPPKSTPITRAEAAALLAEPAVPGIAATATGAGAAAGAAPPRGVFDLGNNRILITDMRVIDAADDHALIVEHPDPAVVAAAQQQSGAWRETIGAFQLGIPVSVKSDMLWHHLRLLSVLRWRARNLSPNDRWHATFHRYIELMADKVRALGGDPWQVPATPDGAIPLPGMDGGGHGHGGGHGGDGGGGQGGGGGAHQPWHSHWYWHWLLILLLVLLILLIWAATRP